MAVHGLDDDCPVCGRVSGDHTLREWAVCLEQRTTDVPFEAMPDDAVGAAATEAVRKQLGDDDLVLVDGVVVKALALGAETGPVAVRVPALLHEFQVNVSGGPPATVAKVLFTAGDPDGMRGYGRLVRDTANGAANAVERAS